MPPDALASCHAIVVGVGSVGRQVALQLAALGIPRMTLIDPDTVSEENLGCQGFWETDIGHRKVDAVANVCHQQFPMLDLTARAERFRKSAVRGWPPNQRHALFLGVDSIDSRRQIWEATQRTVSFLTDGRMAAEVIRILASDHPAHDRHYPQTLFPSEESYRGRCTAQSTIYSANLAAGLMVSQFARWLRRLPVIRDQTLNLLAAELTVSDGQ